MSLIRTVAPAIHPVLLNEAKAHLRVDFDDEDMLIDKFTAAAVQRLDGRDGTLGRCLITQTWKLTLDRFPPEIVIPLPPCQSVSAITYVDADGAAQTLDPSRYQVIGLGGSDPARVRPAFGQAWPGFRQMPEGIAITFTAGFGDDPEDVPETIRAAIRLHVGHLYEHRESVMLGSGFITELPDGAADLIRNHRIWEF